MEPSASIGSSAILSYLVDPELPASLIEGFFRAAVEFADARPWGRLQPAASFPILLQYLDPPPEAQRLALMLGGAQSGGDALGLVLVQDLPQEEDGHLTHPALSVLYAGYPEHTMVPLRWRGRPLPRSRAGLLAWPTVHDVDGRVRAPRRQELEMLTCGLLAVLRFLDGYPSHALDDAAPHPHRCELTIEGLPGRVRVCATPFQPPR
ncbi:MAG: hypothetical protein RMK29_17990 [Myxococcales bacterium]|nr:hypothetical protein [Myxococcota bacterium]MDW8283602.1 hypothetical protein [Myxococcales bacterium]